MRRPSVETFVGFVRKYDKRIGLKLLYRDFQPETEEEKDKFRRAWNAIAKEIGNAAQKGNIEGDNIAEYQNGNGARQAAESSRSDCPQYGETIRRAPAPQEEETLSES